jgi:hypothetical protein
LKLIGKIDSIFSIGNIGDVIVTDCNIAGSFNPDSFPSGTELELRNSGGKQMRLHIRSAELTLREGKDYLSFILKERIDKNEIMTFDEAWCEISLEPGG